MKKEELEFRNTLATLDSEFADFLLDIDFKLLEIDGISNINPFKLRKNYWSKPTDEVTISPNANLGNVGDNKNFINQIAEVNNPVEKLSGLYSYRKYANRRKFNGDKIINDVLSGALYIHNLTLWSLPYCIGLSTYPLMGGQVQFSDVATRPPQRPSSFTTLCTRYIYSASNNFAGATALTDYLVNYSYYTKKDGNYTEKSRINDFQNLIHAVNDRVRLSGQSPFVNLSILSPDTIRNMFSNYVWGDYKVDDLMDEIMINQIIYLQILSRGILGDDGKPIGLPYRFPITTFVVDASFEKEYSGLYREILLLNKDLCFLNILNNSKTDLKALAMCCRLNINYEELLKVNANNTFGSFMSVGSHAVVTINFPRIAYESKNWGDFERILLERADEARKLLLVHRKDVLSERRIKYHDFFKSGMLDLKRNFFSTIGFIGVADAIGLMGGNICSGEGHSHALKAIELLKQESIRYTKEDEVMYNIEEVPGESSAVTLAKKDKLLYKGTKDFYNTQFVPLSYNIPLGKRVEVESEFQKITTGGCICHINFLDELDDESGFKLQDDLIKKTSLVHYALNRGFTMCPQGHNISGVYDKCPKCGSTELDYLTRIVGYFVPVKLWNKGKKLEFATRVWQNLDVGRVKAIPTPPIEVNYNNKVIMKNVG